MNDAPAAPDRIRLDKWLFHARFYKTRSLASKAVQDGRVRVNSARVDKPATSVKAGDVLTFVKVGRVSVVEIVALGVRRGPSPEARALYRDLTAAEDSASDLDPSAAADGKTQGRNLEAPDHTA